MQKLTTLLSSAALLVLANHAFAGTIEVPTDFPTVQAAVDAAVEGDVILVSPGSYRENVTVITSGITIKGPKAIIDGAYAGTAMTVTADDVALIGLEFVNGGVPATEGAAEGGGLDYTGSGAFILKCEASGSAGFGIRLTGHGELESNVVAACLGAGIVVDTGDQTGEQVLLRDNEVFRSGSGIEADDGPFMFDRNTVSNNTGDGIRLTVLSAGSTGTPNVSTEFTHNHCIGNGGTGMSIQDEVGAVTVIEDGDMQLNTVGLDIVGSNVVISSNDIDLNRAGGVFLKTTGATLESNRLRRNTLVGILVSAPEGVTDGSNMLTKNKLEANGGDGIHITSGLNTVDNNYMKDNKGDGLQVAAGAAGNTLNDNIVRQSKHDGIDNWGTDTLITANTCKESVGADLAGIGDGSGTVNPASVDNEVEDGTGLETTQELELDTLAP